MRMQELFDGTIIDLDEICVVGTVGGDPDWLRYPVFFKSGHEITIYEDRVQFEDKKLPQLRREKLISRMNKVTSK
jgi:hypothetical protein